MSAVTAAGFLAVAEPAQAAFPGENGKIAFVSYRDRASDGDIYAMNADGSGLRRLTDDAVNDGYPSWSPGGSKIAFSSSDNGKPGIFTMHPDGTGKTRLSTTWDRSMASDEAPTGPQMVRR